jgi:tetratricopeptide (TPR) repeat protein
MFSLCFAANWREKGKVNRGIAAMTPAVRMLMGIAAMVATPLAAQDILPAPAPLPDLSAMSGEQVLALFNGGGDRWIREPCEFGVPVTAALAQKVGKTEPIRRAQLFAQALCADVEQRYADGAKFAEQLVALGPDQPRAFELSLYFAKRLEDGAGALTILRRLDGKALEQVSKDDYWQLSRAITRSGLGREFDALALAWVADGRLAFIDGDLHEALAIRGLREAAREGRANMVDQLLVLITSPPSYIDLLTSRDYEPFWPQIEARAGANLTTVGAEHVRMTAAGLTNAMKDRDRLSDAAHALHYNGQFEDAIALAQRWRARAGREATFEEGDGWALNIEAYAYDSLGQQDKADAVFEELAKLDPNEHPWVVNFVINRASRLTGQGRWEEGLAATILAREVAEEQGTAFAKTIIARDRACALLKLGRAQEADGELAFLRANWKDGIEFAVKGLMCHGQREEAASLLLEGLRDETLRDTALAAFQTDELDLFYTASTLPDARDLLPDYPELAAELAKHMRAMPEDFIPQAALKRVALKEGPPR